MQSKTTLFTAEKAVTWKSVRNALLEWGGNATGYKLFQRGDECSSTGPQGGRGGAAWPRKGRGADRKRRVKIQRRYEHVVQGVTGERGDRGGKGQRAMKKKLRERQRKSEGTEDPQKNNPISERHYLDRKRECIQKLPKKKGKKST